LQLKSKGSIATEIKGLPRMADFAEIGEIISRCMGYKNNKFIGAYYGNIDLQVEEAIAANAIGTTITELIENKQEWKGTATQLLKELEAVADELKINTSHKSWPKGPNSLSRRIKEVKTNLREVGITIDRYVIDQKTKAKGIKICKISSEPSESKNHAQFSSNMSDDTDNNRNVVSSDKIPQNRAQNSVSDDKDDTDGILHTLHGDPSNDIEQQQIPDPIFRLGHSDTWACHNCSLRGDRWFMIKHQCKGGVH
jgi:hypothetical protein